MAKNQEFVSICLIGNINLRFTYTNIYFTREFRTSCWHAGCCIPQCSQRSILHWHVVATCSSRFFLAIVSVQFLEVHLTTSSGQHVKCLFLKNIEKKFKKVINKTHQREKEHYLSASRLFLLGVRFENRVGWQLAVLIWKLVLSLTAGQQLFHLSHLKGTFFRSTGGNVTSTVKDALQKIPLSFNYW